MLLRTISILLLNKFCFPQTDTDVYISSSGNDIDCKDYSYPCKTFGKSLEILNEGTSDKNV
jgi:hypothetical protein